MSIPVPIGKPLPVVVLKPQRRGFFDSIFDGSTRLPCVLLSGALVLAAGRIAFLVGGATILFGLPCSRTGLLFGVAGLLALLRLLGRPRQS